MFGGERNLLASLRFVIVYKPWAGLFMFSAGALTGAVAMGLVTQ